MGSNLNQMDIKRLLAGIMQALTITTTTFSQEITQVVRGTIVDEESQMPSADT